MVRKVLFQVFFMVLYFGVDGGMHFLLMVEILTLICLTYCWVYVKLEIKVLK
jgi:hypothetical protein